MRIYCDTCEGTGWIEDDEAELECLDCEGAGFTENETIEDEAEIGRALLKAFKNGLFIGRRASVVEDDVPYLPYFFNVKDLLKWAKIEGES